MTRRVVRLKNNYLKSTNVNRSATSTRPYLAAKIRVEVSVFLRLDSFNRIKYFTRYIE